MFKSLRDAIANADTFLYAMGGEFSKSDVEYFRCYNFTDQCNYYDWSVFGFSASTFYTKRQSRSWADPKVLLEGQWVDVGR